MFTRLNPVETCEWMESNPGQQFVLRHPMGLTIAIPNTPCTGRIIRYIDGERSLETIFQMVAADMESMTATPLAKYDFLSSFMGIYNVCSELEWLRLRHESVPAYPTYQEMQSRVTSQYAAKDHVA